jgi:hypothetical protein
MNTVINKSQIVPFSTSAAMRKVMYARKLPEVLWMPVVFYHLPGLPSAGLGAIAHRLQIYLLRTHGITDIRSHCIVPRVHVIEMPQCVTSALQPQQLAWMNDSVYLQAGYCDEPGVIDIANSVACAMTVNDTCVCLSGNLQPDTHIPLAAIVEETEEYERIVRNHYRSGVGVWSKYLEDHRNQILIRSRAFKMGCDPDAEYERFKAAGSEYFLDYPQLCL